jgi:hypothetical protein
MKNEVIGSIRAEGSLRDEAVNGKVVLAGLWAALMFVYLYADLLSLFRPGQLGRMMSGYMGPFEADQVSLLLAGLLMLVSIAMVPLSLALPARANRAANIAAGAFLALVAIANLVGDAWAYYLAYGAVELALLGAILYRSAKWPREELAPASP